MQGRVGGGRRRGGGGALGDARAGGRTRGRARRASSASATRPSRARPAAGPATRTARSSNVDALGSTAYYDNARQRRDDPRLPSLEVGGDRHRRRRDRRRNLACSGARTYTQPFASGSDFKPGLDFYNDGAGHMGQALVLQQFAATHNVKMVVALIGANDYDFADIVQSCVRRLADLAVVVEELLQRRLEHDARTSPPRTSPRTPPASRTRSSTSRTAMRNAGYARRRGQLLVQTYSVAAAARLAASATRRPASRARRSAAAASGTPTPTGPTTPSWPTFNSTVRNAAAARPG